MFPKDTVVLDNAWGNDNKSIGRSFDFDYEKGLYAIKDGKIGEIEGNEAVIAWVEQLIRTPKRRYKIYEDTDFGIDIEKYIGYKQSNLGYVKSELKRDLTEALLQNRAISGIRGFDAINEKDRLKVYFILILKNADELEVNTIV